MWLICCQVPIGGEDAAKVVREYGERPDFAFAPKDHLQLGEALDLIDFETAANVSGTKFVYLKRAAALLEMALCNFALQRVASRGFVPMTTPDLVRESVLEKCGFQPRAQNTQVSTQNLSPPLSPKSLAWHLSLKCRPAQQQSMVSVHAAACRCTPWRIRRSASPGQLRCRWEQCTWTRSCRRSSCPSGWQALATASGPRLAREVGRPPLACGFLGLVHSCPSSARIHTDQRHLPVPKHARSSVSGSALPRQLLSDCCTRRVCQQGPVPRAPVQQGGDVCAVHAGAERGPACRAVPDRGGDVQRAGPALPSLGNIPNFDKAYMTCPVIAVSDCAIQGSLTPCILGL